MGAWVNGRLPDWEARLWAYLAAHRCTPFAWGTHDCALFGIGAYEAITGVDVGHAVRGRYTTLAGAARWLNGRTFAEAIHDTLLYTDMPVPFAARGDLVIFAGENMGTLGVVCGVQSAVPGVAGIVWRRTLDAQKAWQV